MKTTSLHWHLKLIASLALCAFVHASEADVGVSFIAMGDWGREGKDHQTEVAQQMAVTGAAIDSQFVLALGDNFYDNGVQSVDDPQWKTSFESIYTAPVLQRPWYVALGNHDYRTNVQAQIDYSKRSPRWRLPARWHSFTIQVDANTTAEFFIIDTSPFVGAYRSEPKYMAVLDQNPAAQVAWLADKLAKSTAQWKFVAGHHPIYSCGGKHGDTPELIRDINPLLERYGVQAYFNGHEHDMQHLQVGSIDYFCSGAASATRLTEKNERTLFSLGLTSGFLAVTLTADTMRARFIDEKGVEVYATVVSRAPLAAAVAH
ncbi:MAG: tartrate-resistant acid phosphatase type 5 family protein [Opitutus sp.]